MRVASANAGSASANERTPDGGTVAVYTDITELKQREVELERAKSHAELANEAKSSFLASMSHELRTPLNAIIGYSEMLIEDANDRQMNEFVPDVEKIAGAGRHLLALINDILDLSKIEANKMANFLETFDVADLLRDVQAHSRATDGEKPKYLRAGPRGRSRENAFGPDEAASEPLQSTQQRGQVHRRGPCDACNSTRQEIGRRLANIQSVRHRDRDDAGAARTAL